MMCFKQELFHNVVQEIKYRKCVDKKAMYIIIWIIILVTDWGRLRGLTVVCWTTDHGVGISEGCFIFDFASLPLEVAWVILGD